MGALEAVRVLELGESIAASSAGMLLADFGADVVKVERPSGDPTRREPGFATWNRGKRSVVLDPASEQGRSWLARSMLGADVCILGPGQRLADWGDEVAEATRRNARLVRLDMPAYLPQGAPWVGGKESNALLSAAGAVSWRQSSDDGAPVEPVYPHLVYIQGLWAAVCCVAALVERECSGFGQTVEVTGMNAVMEAATYALTVDPNAPDPRTDIGSLGRHPTYRPVRAQDAWLASGALGPKFERALLEILGISHILDDPRLDGKTQNMVLPENLDWATEEVAGAFRRKPRAHWLDAMAERGIPAGPLLDRDEWLDHPQIIANNLRAEVDDPERGRVVMPGVAATLTATPGAVRGPAPILGQHNGMEPWPAQPQPEGKPPITAGPLSHLRVLNLGTFVASPYSGFLFAELGADVVKVEPPTGDPFRGRAFTVNRGMRSLALDLRNEQGKQLFHTVAQESDVVVDAMRPGVMAKLGIDYEALKDANRNLITTTLSAYGMHGELASAGGVDMVIQGMSGMMLAQGYEEHPFNNTIAILDVTTAAVIVLASVLALYHREKTDEGQRTWVSLIGTSTFLASGELTRFDARHPAPRGGLDHKGHEPLDRYYVVADGWIRVQASDPREVTVEALKAVGIAVDELSVDALGDALRGMSGAQAVAAFAEAGLPAVEARRVSQLFHDQDLLASQFAHFRTADDGRTLATPGRYATLSRTQRAGPLTPPGVGEHSEEVLRRAGVPSQEITRAIESGVVVQGARVPVAVPVIYR